MCGKLSFENFNIRSMKKIMIMIMIGATLFTISCNAPTNKQGEKEVEEERKMDAINTDVDLSVTYAEKIKNDQRVVDYLNEYHETLYDFYSDMYNSMILNNTGDVIKNIVKGIYNAFPLLKLEQRRNSFKEEFSEEKMNLIYQEENKITKVINYSYYEAINDKQNNSYRKQVAGFLTETEESLEEHVQNVREKLNDFECKVAEFRYLYIMNYFVADNEYSVSALNTDLDKINKNRQPITVDDTVVTKYAEESKERELMEAFVILTNELSNQDYDYLKVKDDWSDAKKQTYTTFFDAVDNVILLNIASLKKDLSTVPAVDFYNIQKK